MGVVGWGVVLVVLGWLIQAVGTPQRDRRFRTGFKHNDVPNDGMIAVGGATMFVGVVVAIIGWNCCQPPAPPTEPDMADARDMTAPADLAMPRRRHHRRHADAGVADLATRSEILDPY